MGGTLQLGCTIVMVTTKYLSQLCLSRNLSTVQCLELLYIYSILLQNGPPQCLAKYHIFCKPFSTFVFHINCPPPNFNKVTIRGPWAMLWQNTIIIHFICKTYYYKTVTLTRNAVVLSCFTFAKKMNRVLLIL